MSVLNTMLKIATLNLCLGLKFKKDLVKDIMSKENIDILLMQETEIEHDFDVELLNIPGYILELEKNECKIRVATYVKNSIKYIRRSELEGVNNHIQFIDLLNGEVNYKRLVNVYHSFNPLGITDKDLFTNQCDLIKVGCSVNSIIIGDFNLDYRKKNDVNYCNAQLFSIFDDRLEDLNLVQLVKFDTWSRTVELVVRSSILDHIYVNDIDLVKNVCHMKPIFGDHELIMADVSISRPISKVTWGRDWRHYSKEKLVYQLSLVDWTNDAHNVQQLWNDFEAKLIKVVDDLAPLTEFKDGKITLTQNPVVKHKLNLRNRLLKLLKKRPTLDLKKRIKKLNVEIKSHFTFERKNFIRRKIIPGNSKSLWNAVKAAKDIGTSNLPVAMKIAGRSISEHERSDCFAAFFVNKVETITNETIVDQNVYNGVPKLVAGNQMFMSINEVENCIKCIKVKNCEGYDRIPQRVLIEGLEHLLCPLSKLLESIYVSNEIPEQWLFSKIIPVHKKGNKSVIENYRPVANLCSASKIFERLILNRINQLEVINGIDISGKGQHGFKKGKGTSTAGLLLQSLISRALDDDNFVAMASLDLSSAFDVVNIPLLIKRLNIIGLPGDVINLIEIWLKNRCFYVEIDNVTSNVLATWFGIIQGSILGPILYAIFISPIFDIENMTCYADDGFSLVFDKDKEVVCDLIKIKLMNTIDWLTRSGMKVNESKTNLCLFYYKDTNPIEIVLNGVSIKSCKTVMYLVSSLIKSCNGLNTFLTA